MKSVLLIVVLVSLTSITVSSAFAEGGGGVDCAGTSEDYTYVNGSALYETYVFDEDEFGSLFCEFTSDVPNIVQFGSIETMYHFGGELSQQLIEEYGCGEKLGYEMSPLFVSSPTHFAVVTYSTSSLQATAENILNQIEQQNLATICATDSSEDPNIQKTDDEAEEEIKKMIEQMDEAVEWIIDEEDELDEGIVDDLTQDLQLVIPEWIKDNAGWWASDQITDDDYYSGIEYLINEGVIVLPPTEAGSKTSEDIPTWIKFNAGWWSEGQITDSEFIDGLQFLISKGIISVK